ncbi:MAG TPA: LD-carboxypeptidase [Exiguobacterium sp.]|nr:LD-carboxypeptidase [Exiguobacterium sp.]
MKYPFLGWTGQTIGVTAPSSGLREQQQEWVERAVEQVQARQMNVRLGETIWSHQLAASAPVKQRAEELNQMMTDETIDAVIPPFGGERAIDLLPELALATYQPKWLLGYSDISTLLLSLTLQTGMATAHGPNFVELRSEEWDETTSAWRRVLATPTGGTVTQWASDRYQSEWTDQERPAGSLFQLTEATEWKALDERTEVTGRILGGCLETIRHLIGTPYGDVQRFQREEINGEPILWYFEVSEASSAEVHRTLRQMAYAGWFDHAAGFLFGRTSARITEDLTWLDVYQYLADETALPVLYDLDIGHQPPQLTLINGATGTVRIQGKDSRIDLTFN